MKAATQAQAMFCGEASLVNPGRSAFRAVTLKCRSWACGLCRPMRQRQLIDLLVSGQPTTFLTLTVNPALGTSPAGRARALVDAWRALVRLICDEFAVDHIPYACVMEAQQSGEPHLHILCRLKYIPQAWLSDQMQNLIGAPIVDIRSARDVQHLAKYLAKYLGKDPHRFGTGKRYWTTRDWVLGAPDREPDDPIWSGMWHVSKWPLAVLAAAWKSKGWDVVIEGDMVVAMAREPP